MKKRRLSGHPALSLLVWREALLYIYRQLSILCPEFPRVVQPHRKLAPLSTQSGYRLQNEIASFRVLAGLP